MDYAVWHYMADRLLEVTGFRRLLRNVDAVYDERQNKEGKQDNIPVGCVPPACQPIRVLVTTTRCQYQWGGWGVGPQVNKFEQSPVMTTRCQYQYQQELEGV